MNIFGKIIVYILTGAAILLFLFAIINYPNCHEQELASIIERPNCTLVKVEASGFDRSLGYVDNDIISEFVNGSLNKNIIVYHPFEEDAFKVVDSSTVQTIITITKEELLDITQ